MESFNGTIISLKRCPYWQYNCAKCKLQVEKCQPNANQCIRCGFSSFDLQYKLLIEADTSLGLLVIKILGSCLDQYFGEPCNAFVRKISHLKHSWNEISLNLNLNKCVEEYFVGCLFQFSYDTDNAFEQCKGETVKSHLVTRYFVVQRKVKKTLIMENLLLCLQTFSKNDSHMKDAEEVGIAENEQLHFDAAEYLNGDCNVHNSINSNEDSSSKSFAFLQDSFIISLLRKYDVAASLSSTNQSDQRSYKLNSSKSYPDLRNLGIKRADLATDSNCFFTQSWPSQNVVNPQNRSREMSFALLDVTLPVLNSQTLKRKADVLSQTVKSPHVPKLRRCRSLAFENELLPNETELAFLFESFLNDQPSQTNQLEPNVTMEPFSASNFKRTSSQIALSGGSLLPTSTVLDQSFTVPSKSTNMKALPVISSTPKPLLKTTERKHICSPLALPKSLLNSSQSQNSCDLFKNEKINNKQFSPGAYEKMHISPALFNHSADMFE